MFENFTRIKRELSKIAKKFDFLDISIYDILIFSHIYQSVQPSDSTSSGFFITEPTAEGSAREYSAVRSVIIFFVLGVDATLDAI